MRFKKATILFFNLLIMFISCDNSDKKDNKYEFTNDLVNETSPYLLQHAHNPVDWKPWSQNALNTAKQNNKLIVISIGYSSCHWCHVMEKETFSDNSIAKLMNENFINIKVDREERPDVDNIYMTAVQLMNGSGGWPLNVIALPDGKPLYGGTYHSKEDWEKVLLQVNDFYKNKPEQAQDYAENLEAGIQKVNQIQNESSNKDFIEEDILEIFANSKSKWDTIWGGNSTTQKFMMPINLDFLLDYGTVNKDSSALNQLKLTLDYMALEGVNDHVDGGFFRYSTDKKWEIPHFEKMLYDNAQLISTYSKAYKVFKDPLYKEVVSKTFGFLDKALKSESNTYFASVDSGLEEGAYYLWTEKELSRLVVSDFDLFKSYFSIDKSNILAGQKYHLVKSENDKSFAKKHGLEYSAFLKLKSEWDKSLSQTRLKRQLPEVDDKIIVSWNALAIIGFLDAYSAFDEEVYLQSAISTFKSLKSRAFNNNGLIHSYKANSKKSEVFLEDYAFLQKAALKLYSITTEDYYLQFAEQLNGIIFSEYSDNEGPMFTFSKSRELISKIIKTDEGVMPSANSVVAENLFLLGHIKYNNEYLNRSKRMLQSIVSYSKEKPDSFSNWNSLLIKTVYPFYEIAVVGENAEEQLLKLNKYHYPNTLMVGTTKQSLIPLYKSRFVEDETYIYVCKDKTCKLPVKTSDAAINQLNSF